MTINITINSATIYTKSVRHIQMNCPIVTSGKNNFFIIKGKLTQAATRKILNILIKIPDIVLSIFFTDISGRFLFMFIILSSSFYYLFNLRFTYSLLLLKIAFKMQRISQIPVATRHLNLNPKHIVMSFISPHVII